MPTDLVQVFRVYRDIRFSPDPTPYKVEQSCPATSAKTGLLIGYSHFSLQHGRCPYKYHSVRSGCVAVLNKGRSRSGRKGPYAAYYVQIGPKEGSFVGRTFDKYFCVR